MNDIEKSKTVYKIFQDINNRNKWYELISPLIENVNYENGCSSIGSSWYSFTPEELDINYNWKFNIGDIVKNKNGDILKIVNLPLLDPRRSEYNNLQVQEFGNKYHVEDGFTMFHIDYRQDELELVQ